jgi:hypothetical protein
VQLWQGRGYGIVIATLVMINCRVVRQVCRLEYFTELRSSVEDRSEAIVAVVASNRTELWVPFKETFFCFKAQKVANFSSADIGRWLQVRGWFGPIFNVNGKPFRAYALIRYVRQKLRHVN